MKKPLRYRSANLAGGECIFRTCLHPDPTLAGILRNAVSRDSPEFGVMSLVVLFFNEFDADSLGYGAQGRVDIAQHRLLELDIGDEGQNYNDE
ncbi:MAG: hypothetical protein KBE04_13985 [Phycisphaerae bacterium]|nr:hypothetical protein [Phycisphaerae bacterium]